MHSSARCIALSVSLGLAATTSLSVLAQTPPATRPVLPAPAPAPAPAAAPAVPLIGSPGPNPLTPQPQSPVQTLTLLELYRSARAFDAAYLAARSQAESEPYRASTCSARYGSDSACERAAR